MILKTSYQEIQCNISSYPMTPVTMGHRMSPDFPTEHKLNAPNTPRISGSTKSRQSMPASADKNIWHHDTPCHEQENATHLVLLSRDQDTLRQVQDPNKCLNQTLSPYLPIHNHRISATIYSVSLKDNCPKHTKTTHTPTHTTKKHITRQPSKTIKT